MVQDTVALDSNLLRNTDVLCLQRPQSTRSQIPRYEAIKMPTKWSPHSTAEPLGAPNSPRTRCNRHGSEVMPSLGPLDSHWIEHPALPICTSRDFLTVVDRRLWTYMGDVKKRSALIDSPVMCVVRNGMRCDLSLSVHSISFVSLIS